MKEIKAYIRVIMIDDVLNALEEIGAPSTTAIDVRALGREVSPRDFKISLEYGTTYTPMVKLEIICSDDDALRIVDTIKKHAHTGRKGDGIIAISTVDQLVSIRTGETGNDGI